MRSPARTLRPQLTRQFPESLTSVSSKFPDPRLDELSGIFRPKKTTHAVVEYVDFIGLTRGNMEQNRKIFDLIKDVDATVHVVRAFQDEAVVNPAGETDLFRDIETIELELIFGDLELVEKRLERMEDGKETRKETE